MAELHVEVSIVDAVTVHPNADRLELASIKGWQTVVVKDQYKAGDRVVYVPIDSILSPKLEELLFPAGSKIKLDKGRIRSIRIRQAVSQGMIVGIDESLETLYPGISKKRVGSDVAEFLGVTKWEPPVDSLPSRMAARPITHNNPYFQKYTDIDNIKFYPGAFSPDEEVYITEKIHGTSARYAILPTNVHGWKKRLRKWLHLLPAYEFCYGSRNIQLQAKVLVYPGYESEDGENVYAWVARTFNLAKILRPNEQLYGEIVGPGIQKNYIYGYKPGTWGFYAYDVRVDGSYLSSKAFQEWCDEREVPRVPVLFEGYLRDTGLDQLRSGPSVLAPTTQPIREGTVIKPKFETFIYTGRKVLKHINDEYLLHDQTEFH